tara:strand:+ start:231 stop:524 length:294 start_codon:yes stop_codon:yes gene_type:complete
MGKELNEDTGFKISVKTLIAIAVGITTVVSFWFAFQADLNDIRDEVEVAKKLPEPTITRTEYELKDELVRQTIMDTQEDVQDIKHKLERIEDHIMNQ